MDNVYLLNLLEFIVTLLLVMFGKIGRVRPTWRTPAVILQPTRLSGCRFLSLPQWRDHPGHLQKILDKYLVGCKLVINKHNLILKRRLQRWTR